MSLNNTSTNQFLSNEQQNVGDLPDVQPRVGEPSVDEAKTFNYDFAPTDAKLTLDYLQQKDYVKEPTDLTSDERIQRKRFLLTSANNETSVEQALSVVKRLFDKEVKTYVIKQELHHGSQRHHLHVYLDFRRQKDFKARQFLSRFGEIFSGSGFDARCVQNETYVLMYLLKKNWDGSQGAYLSNIDDLPKMVNARLNKKSGIWARILAMCRKDKPFKEILRDVEEIAPHIRAHGKRTLREYYEDYRQEIVEKSQCRKKGNLLATIPVLTEEGVELMLKREKEADKINSEIAKLETNGDARTANGEASISCLQDKLKTIHKEMAQIKRKHKSLRNLVIPMLKNRKFRQKQYAFVGDTHLGKSSIIRFLSLQLKFSCFELSDNNNHKGFSDDHACIYFDEFDRNSLPLRTLHRVLDGSIGVQLNEKYGSSTKNKNVPVIITSNRIPDTWYDFKNEDKQSRTQLKALKDRLYVFYFVGFPRNLRYECKDGEVIKVDLNVIDQTKPAKKNKKSLDELMCYLPFNSDDDEEEEADSEPAKKKARHEVVTESEDEFAGMDLFDDDKAKEEKIDSEEEVALDSD
jgi:hypothetical protein